MGIFMVEVWIPVEGGNHLAKVVYYVEAAESDTAKSKAFDLYIKNVVPNLIAVTWAGPLTVEKTEAAPVPTES